jgi:thiol-disulfide isomerase/thioredoxin
MARTVRSQKSKHMILIAVIVAVAIVATAYYLQTRTHEGFTGSDDLYLVMFKTDWCGYCQKALPAYNQLMHTSNGAEVGSKKLYFDIINPETDTDKIVVNGAQIKVKSSYSQSQTVEVKGYPTYYLYGRPEGPIQYSGKLDRDSIVAFAAA